MKYTFASLAIVLVVALQGCSSGGGYYDASAYDKDYQKYKMEKEMERDLEKKYSGQEMKGLEKALEKKYGK